MKAALRLSVSCLLALLVASCSSGDDEEVPNTQYVPFTLVATGVAPAGAPILPSAVTVIRNQAELDQLRQGRFTPPASLANFDFTQGDIVYVEANGDRDPTSVARLLQVSRNGDSDFVTAETCSTVSREPGDHRPFALYTLPKLNVIEAVAMSLGFFDCPSAKRLPATLVAAGSPSPFCCLPPRPPTFIRDQATLNALAALLPAGTIPAAYAAPDFSQVTLVYLEVVGQSDAQGYVRVMGVYESVDASRDIVAERCEVTTDFEAPFASYAIYAIPRIATDARIAFVSNAPPNCLTTR
jgi:hypothetical protein